MQLTRLAHHYLETHLNDGALAIDATAGNGHDTLKMAELVGATGIVITVDIQSEAIESTRKRLNESGLESARLIHGDHAKVLSELCNEYSDHAAAITFNLGYLPGSDKQVQTNPETTRAALDAAMTLLSKEGVLLVTAYRGHSGGIEEASAVEEWMRVKQTEGYTIKSHEPSAIRIPPILWVLKDGG
ncbi:MAG: class I SAM-dependent methyltransferase [Lentimonas sp.]